MIGIGCDIVQINRIQSNKEALAKRILSKKEKEQYDQYKGQRQLEFLAGHFAAKEALVKAMDKNCLITDFDIYYENKKPVVKKEGYQISLSISHEKDYAMAVALIQRSQDEVFNNS
ncbi:MAG: holo-ACP synthase [Floccifex sp.]